MNEFSIYEKWKGKEPPNMYSLGNYPIAYPGLTIYHGLSGSMKSYSSVIIAKELEYDVRYYLDFEGNNQNFKQHCIDNNVMYLNMSSFGSNEFDLFMSDISHISKAKKVIIILDSFSRLYPIAVNETHKIDEIFKKLKQYADIYNISLLLIDHSRKTDYGIDIRGGDNKKKFADVVLKVKKANIKDYETIIQIEKSRLLNFKLDYEFKISTKIKDYKKEFLDIVKKKNIFNKRELFRSLSKKQQEKFNIFKDNFDELIKELL